MFDTSIFVAVLGIALICIALLISHFKKKEIERKNIILSIQNLVI